MQAPKEPGRIIFKKYRPIITLLTKLAYFLPQFLRNIIWHIFDSSDGKIGAAVRYLLIANLTRSCGDNVFIGRGVILKNIHNLQIGNNVSIHAGCYIDAFGGITIGDDVSIAHQSSIVAFEHTWTDTSLPIKYNPVRSSGISISSDVWIGCGVRVLDGSAISERVVVAAGAVVKGTLTGSAVYAGAPARQVKLI